MRKPLAAGNWKMNLSIAEGVKLAADLVKALDQKAFDQADVIVAPPFTQLAGVAGALKGSRIELGAQNMSWEAKGAFTGEISASMLKEVGAQWVILGHSERRHVMLETDSMIQRKLEAALAAGLKPILCVGEKLEQRQQNKTFDVIREQLVKGLEKRTPEQIAASVIAYEPVWAIGTGLTASPEQAQEVHAFIRKQIAEITGNRAQESIRILYGGSVTPDNIKGLIAKPDVDGVLVGGASLKADSFERIVRLSTKEN